MKINSISYFSNVSELVFCKSIERFRSEKMLYIEKGTVSSNESLLNCESVKFIIGENLSARVREFVIDNIDGLKEISEMLAVNSPRYIQVSFADGSKMFFEYDESFCIVFDNIKSFKQIKEFNCKQLNENLLNKNENELSELQKLYLKESRKRQRKGKEGVYSADKKNKFYILLIIFVVLAFVLTGEFAGQNDNVYDENTSKEEINYETTEKLSPIVEPESGTILFGEEELYGSQIKIITKENSYVVKIKNRYHQDILSFYVRRDDEVTVGVPADALYVYFASGDTWYGKKHLFGEETIYSKDSELQYFTSEEYWAYTLYPVSNGNFSETIINPEEF